MSSQAVTQAGSGATMLAVVVSYVTANPVAFFFMLAGFIASLVGLWFQHRRHLREEHRAKQERDRHEKQMQVFNRQLTEINGEKSE